MRRGVFEQIMVGVRGALAACVSLACLSPVVVGCGQLLGTTELVQPPDADAGAPAPLPPTPTVQAPCAPGALRCAGPALQICEADGSGWTRRQLCASVCNGSVLRLCNPERTERVDAANCGTASQCNSGLGRCDERPCAPGELRCNGSALERCIDAQRGWERLQTCETAGLCQLSLDGDRTACTPRRCTPGEQRCTGQQLQVCNAQLTEFTTLATCPTGQVCDPQGRQCDDCVPGTVSCAGEAFSRCLPNGQLATVQVCGPGLCSASGPNRGCLACTTPNGFRCDAEGSLLSCSANQRSETQLAVCREPELCRADLGVCLECDPPGGSRCEGNQVLACGDDNRETLAQSCASAAACRVSGDLAACDPSQCQVSRFACAASGELLVCDAARTAFVSQSPPFFCPAPQLCDASAPSGCRTPVCLPGEQRCSSAGNAIERCNASQTGFERSESCAPSGLTCIERPDEATCGCEPGELRCGLLGGLARCEGDAFERVAGGAACDGATLVSCSLLGLTTRTGCDDGQFCNGRESCAGGACRPGQPPCVRADLCSEEGDRCVDCAVDGDCGEGRTCSAGTCGVAAVPRVAAFVAYRATDAAMFCRRSRPSLRHMPFVLVSVLSSSACTDRIIVFGPPPDQALPAAGIEAMDAPTTPAATIEQPQQPALHYRVATSDREVATRALSLMGGADGRSGSCSGCHALGRPTLTSWRQLTESFRAVCPASDTLRGSADVESWLACIEDRSGTAELWKPSSFGIYAAAAHLPWFTQLFEWAARDADPAAALAGFVARVGMPRAGARWTQAEFDDVAEWFERGLPDLYELVPEESGEACSPRIDPPLLAHLDEMALSGWRARNTETPLLMFGCLEGQAPEECLADAPLARDSSEGSAWDMPGSRIRILFDNSASPSRFWTRTSADGRYVASGLRQGTPEAGGQIVDLLRGRAIPADYSYDPAFFPDNSAFMLQRTSTATVRDSSDGVPDPSDEAILCPQSLLAAPPPLLTGNETGCSRIGGTLGLYQQLAATLDGDDHWVAHGIYVEDDRGFSPVARNPSADFPSDGSVTLTRLINGGNAFEPGAVVRASTPFQGDPMLSPSGRLLLTRVKGNEQPTRVDDAELVLAEQSGYALHLVTTSLQPGTPTLALREVGRVCLTGGKPMISYDERWMVLHHYVVAEDATELGFEGPTDPAFSQYLSQGAANLYLVDLRDGSSRRITSMGPGEYAVYPHFRSDGWIIFAVRSVADREYFASTDAALLLE